MAAGDWGVSAPVHAGIHTWGRGVSSPVHAGIHTWGRGVSSPVHAGIHTTGGLVYAGIHTLGVCPSACWDTPPSPVDRILNTRLWKHYLSTTTLRTVTINGQGIIRVSFGCKWFSFHIFLWFYLTPLLLKYGTFITTIVTIVTANNLVKKNISYNVHWVINLYVLYHL